ncbi:hypothetical protein Sgou_31960 [Streptomyces gougerotii]|uniref:Uncharacterized protein n=1 Tax=Streptomyces gougerotii TaxID=53448 RepID=A0A8H9LPN0_9ACTN|nr:hypothetical protein Sgou_31960 [Streptomyces gougerotii]GGU91306.1 hypothetical protein GCM10010227_53170 [Streptomyces gougerotii]
MTRHVSPEDRTPSTARPPSGSSRALAWIGASIAVVSLGAVIILGMQDRTEAAVAAGAIGVAFAAGSITVTVNIRE